MIGGDEFIASEDAERDRMRHRYTDVRDFMIGMVANPKVMVADPDELAKAALNYVLAAEHICGINVD